MSTTRKLAHNTIIQLGGKFITTILGLIALMMMTRYLGAEKFGWYTTVITVLTFVGIMTDFGMTPVTAQMMSEKSAYKKEKIFHNLLGFRFITSIIILGITPLITWFFPYPTPVKIAISFTTLSFLAIALNQIFLGLYQTKLKMHINAIAELVSRIILVGGIFLFIRYGSDFLPIMGVITFSTITYTFILWTQVKKESSVRFAFDWPIWKIIISKSWPITAAIVFNVVYLKGDTLLLTFFASQADVGEYGAAYRVIDVVTQSAMMIMGLLLPLMAYAWSHKEKNNFKKYYQQAFDIMMVFGLPIVVGAIILADPIMDFVTSGEEFTRSGDILRILAIALVGLYLGAVFGHTAVAINRQKQTLWIYITNAIITLIGYFIFIPIYGLYGAAWMTVFSEWFTGILLFLSIRKYSGVKLQLKTFLKIMIATVAMGYTIIIFRDLHVLTLVTLAIIIYGAVLVISGGVSRETIREITKRK